MLLYNEHRRCITRRWRSLLNHTLIIVSFREVGTAVDVGVVPLTGLAMVCHRARCHNNTIAGLSTPSGNRIRDLIRLKQLHPQCCSNYQFYSSVHDYCLQVLCKSDSCVSTLHCVIGRTVTINGSRAFHVFRKPVSLMILWPETYIITNHCIHNIRTTGNKYVNSLAHHILKL